MEATESVCFTSSIGSHCLLPTDILTRDPAYPRCVDLCPGDESYCLLPDPRSQLMRLTFMPPSLDQTLSILYRGSKGALLRNVGVGPLSPRFTFAPSWLPFYTERFMRHMLSASLALAAFNLLPIRRLDGDAILASLLEMDVLPLGLASTLTRHKGVIEVICAGSAAWVVLVAFTRALL